MSARERRCVGSGGFGRRPHEAVRSTETFTVTFSLGVQRQFVHRDQ
jgi:hypothetical protein